MKKQLVLLSLVILSGSVSSAFEKVGGSLLDAGMMSVCPEAHGDIDSTICAVFVASSSGFTFSPILTVYVSADGTTQLSKGNHKLLVEAKEDASLFLASNTELRTVRLQNVFNAFRGENTSSRASDVELAQLILTL